MRQLQHSFEVHTRGKGLYEATREIAAWVRESGIRMGLLTVFVRHTSASLVIQENADPTVQSDLEQIFSRLVPDGDPAYRHRMEGPDDMSAHGRSALTQVSLSIPVSDGAPVLGTWQGIYLWEHRVEAQRRHITLHLMGE